MLQIILCPFDLTRGARCDDRAVDLKNVGVGGMKKLPHGSWKLRNTVSVEKLAVVNRKLNIYSLERSFKCDLLVRLVLSGVFVQKLGFLLGLGWFNQVSFKLE